MNHNAPLVSIIMSVYNAEFYLEESIKSILNQSFIDFELIIMNDGSTDKTHEIISSFKDDRIRYVINPENIGIVNILNKSLLFPRGKYISRTDADDIASPDKLQKQVDFMESHPEIDVLGTYYQIINSKGKKGHKVELPSSPGEISLCINFMNTFCNSATLTRASVMKKYGYSKEYEYCEDYWLWTEILKESKGANLPIYSIYYRVHGNNISKLKKNKVIERLKNIFRLGLQNLEFKFSEEEFDLHINFFTLNYSSFRADDRFYKLENWLEKLILFLNNKSHSKENNFLLRYIINIWIPLCYNSGHYKKIIKNKIASVNQIEYYKELIKKSWSKMS